LPATLPSRHGAVGRLTPRQRLARQAADALAALGLHEVVGWSFERPEIATRLRLAQGAAVRVANPMSEEQSQLRTTLIGSLLDAAQRNRAHGASALRLFESGPVYLPRAGESDQLPDEPHHVAALMSGSVGEPTWRAKEQSAADFFAIKGVLAALVKTLRLQFEVIPAPQPFLHPGRAATILVGDQPVGWLGEIHPTVAGEWGLSETVAAFELDLAALGIPSTPMYVDLPSFPGVREDLAVVVSDSVSAADVLRVVRAAGEGLLADARVFDVYRDEDRLGTGNVSLALALTYRSGDRTLTDAEVAQRRAAIATALERELAGRIRAA
jgi:phenylalanyl-tRNA synthetase beta chain